VGPDVDAERTFELGLALARATDRSHHDERTARRQVALATAGLFAREASTSLERLFENVSGFP